MSNSSDFELLVLGGGMGGMTAAAEAALRGARVIVCEVAGELGGTALLSTGNVWTVQTADAFRQADPDGDVELWQVVRDNLEDSLTWVEGMGVPVRERHKASSSSTYQPPPIGRNIDIETFMTRSSRAVGRSGGVVLNGTTVSKIHASANGVTGARITTVATGDEHDIDVPAVVLATGGFQGSRELRARHLGEDVADAVAVRSNPYSAGRGLTLALQVGAATSPRMDSFYGVILPAVPGEITEGDYRGLVLHPAVYGVVLGPDGTRLTDESAGAVGLANAVAHVGRALFVVGPAMIQAAEEKLGIDLHGLIKAAGGRGARIAAADSLHEVATTASQWRYDGGRALDTLTTYDMAMKSGQELSPSRRTHHLALGEEGLLVVEVQAAMTSTYGGVRTNTHGQALTSDGTPLAGLFAVGVDQGGYNVSGYVGGLSRCLVYGRRAGARALEAT